MAQTENVECFVRAGGAPAVEDHEAERSASSLDGEEVSRAAFTVFAPFRSWLGRQLVRLPVTRTAVLGRELRRGRSFRYMYVLRLSPRHFRRIGVPTDGALRNGALLVLSAFDRHERASLRRSVADLAPLHRLFSHCVGGETTRSSDGLARFIERYYRRASTFWSHAEEAPTSLHHAIGVRRKLEDTLRVARSAASDEEFAHAYLGLTRAARIGIE